MIFEIKFFKKDILIMLNSKPYAPPREAMKAF